MVESVSSAASRRGVGVLLAVLWLLAQAEYGTGSAECKAGGGGFECAGPSSVRQCVDGEPRGPAQECARGLVCDVSAPFGPCVPLDPPPCCEEGTFPVPGECRGFTVCVHSGFRLLQFTAVCAPNFEFSVRQRRCVPVEQAGCSIPEPVTSTVSTSRHEDDTPSPITSTPTPSPPPTTVLTSTPTVASTAAVITTSTTRTTTVNPANFECSAPGQFPDPSSCRHYMVCSWASQTKLRAARTPCTAGLYFDTTLRQCVFTAKCGTRPS